VCMHYYQSDVSLQFHFLVAIIFTQCASKQLHLACQRASECLAAYPTPEALSKALPEDLIQYFGGIGRQRVKSPQLIKLAQAYVKDPPVPGRLRSGAKCPRSEISHLPQIGPVSVNAWLVYYCERMDIVTLDKTQLEYMEHLKTKAGVSRL
jgi:endonuclease III